MVIILVYNSKFQNVKHLECHFIFANFLFSLLALKFTIKKAMLFYRWLGDILMIMIEANNINDMVSLIPSFQKFEDYIRSNIAKMFLFFC